MEKIPFYFGYSIIQAEYTTKLSILYSRNQILFLDAPKCGLDASVFHWSWCVVFVYSFYVEYLNPTVFD